MGFERGVAGVVVEGVGLWSSLVPESLSGRKMVDPGTADPDIDNGDGVEDKEDSEEDGMGGSGGSEGIGIVSTVGSEAILFVIVVVAARVVGIGKEVDSDLE